MTEHPNRGTSESELERWRGAFDEMYRLTVIPRRSVDRVRRALVQGTDHEIYLEDIESGMQACVDLMERMDERPEVCPECLGTGHKLPEAHKC